MYTPKKSLKEIMFNAKIFKELKKWLNDIIFKMGVYFIKVLQKKYKDGSIK